MDTWGIILTAIGIGIAGTIAVIFTGLKEIVAEWSRSIVSSMRRKNYLGRIEKLSNFLHHFEMVKQLPEVQRSILFTGHNCGGLPTPGKDYTVRALEGWTTKQGKESPHGKFDFSLRVDAHYTNMLKQMMENGSVDQTTASMDPTAKLKAYHESEGVIFSRMYFLGITDQELIYLSVGSYDQDKFSHSTDIDLQLLVDRMRSLIYESGV